MDRLGIARFTGIMTTTTHTMAPSARPELASIRRAITRRSFCTLATASPTNRPHVAGVLYVAEEDVLYVNTRLGSRKARNVSANPQTFVCIPVRRLPIGPPSSIQFGATADVVRPDDPDIEPLLRSGRLKAITSHGELDLPDSCFLRIRPDGKLLTYGLGLPLRRLLRDPLNAGGSVDLD